MDDELGGDRRPGGVPGPQDQVLGDRGADDADRSLVAVRPEQVGILTDRVDAGGGPRDGQVDDELAHPLAGRLVADAGPAGGLAPTPLQCLFVEPHEEAPNLGPKLRDRQVLGGGQDPCLDRRGDLRLGRPEQVEQRAHLPDVDAAGVQRTPGGGQLGRQEDRLDREGLRLPAPSSCGSSPARSRTSPTPRRAPGTAGAASRARDRREGRSHGRARCADGGRGQRSRRLVRRRSGTRGRRRPRCRRRAPGRSTRQRRRPEGRGSGTPSSAIGDGGISHMTCTVGTPPDSFRGCGAPCST